MGKLIKEDIADSDDLSFHGPFDDLCTINDGEELQKPYKEISSKELVLNWISRYISWFECHYK